MENAAVRLAVFVVGLVASFGAAFGIGRAIGPVDDAPSPHPSTVTTTTMEHGGHS